MKFNCFFFLVLFLGVLLLVFCGNILVGGIIFGGMNMGDIINIGGIKVNLIIGMGNVIFLVDVVCFNCGVVVEGSIVYLYCIGDCSVVVGKVSINVQGYVEFVKILVGSYDLVFMKSKVVGFEFDGVVVKDNVNIWLKIVQFMFVDFNVMVDVLQFKFEMFMVFKVNGEVDIWGLLGSGIVFNDVVNVCVYSVKNSDQLCVMCYFLFLLVNIDKDGIWFDVCLVVGLYEQDFGYVIFGVDFNNKGQGQDSGLVSFDVIGFEGDVYL